MDKRQTLTRDAAPCPTLVDRTGAWAQDDMKKTPLTLEAKTAGTIVVLEPQSGMQYSKNYGAKTELTADAGIW